MKRLFMLFATCLSHLALAAPCDSQLQALGAYNVARSETDVHRQLSRIQQTDGRKEYWLGQASRIIVFSSTEYGGTKWKRWWSWIA